MGESFFLKSSFFRSLLIFIPMGVLMMFYGLYELDKQVDDYPRVEGQITSSQLYWDQSPYSIKINNDQWFDIFEKKYFDTLKKKAIKGKIAVVWYNPRDNSVEKLLIENEILYPYTKNIILWIIVIVIGAFFMIGNLIYIIKCQNHAKGKK